MLTNSQVEAWDNALVQVQKSMPQAPPINEMTATSWSLMVARAVVKAGLFEQYPADTDFDTIPPHDAKAIGNAFLMEYNDALKMPKKNGLKPSAITFTNPKAMQHQNP